MSVRSDVENTRRRKVNVEIREEWEKGDNNEVSTYNYSN